MRIGSSGSTQQVEHLLEQWRQKAKVGLNNTRQLEHSAHMRSGRVIEASGLIVQLGQRLMKIGGFSVRRVLKGRMR